MNILFDGHTFRWQRVGGIRRYFEEVIRRLPSDWAVTLLGTAGGKDTLPYHPKLRSSPVSRLRPRRLTQPLKEAWWRATCKDASIVHPTYYSMTGGLKLSDFRCPKVVTVYDLIGETYADMEADSENTIAVQRQAFAEADHFICISKYTEQDLLSRHPKLSGRTSVIYLASSFGPQEVKQQAPSSNLFERPTFLVVGGRGTYKNFTFLVRAFAKACQVNPHIRLRTAGSPWTPEERWQFFMLGIADRVDETIFPSEAQLADLYKSSVALLYPSWHEGFGIPPLEAMACGTLAVTSDRTSMPEVVGDAGIMLDPKDEDSWISCILEAAQGGCDRSELIERGRRRASGFSWDQTAEAHVELYKKLAHS